MGIVGGAIQRINNPLKGRGDSAVPCLFGNNAVGGIGILYNADNLLFRFLISFSYNINVSFIINRLYLAKIFRKDNSTRCSQP